MRDVALKKKFFKLKSFVPHLRQISHTYISNDLKVGLKRYLTAVKLIGSFSVSDIGDAFTTE